MAVTPEHVNPASLGRRIAAEALGSFFLLAAIVGSGIAAERLSGGNGALALLCNALATGAALAALILALGPISGSHLNPAVTLASAAERSFPWREVPHYVAAQLGGAFVGVACANAMFGEAILTPSHHIRSGSGQLLSELVATFGLLLVIAACSRRRPGSTAFAVATYIQAAYWFTASTAFANPAVTLTRALTDTFTGIRPADVPGFIAAQLVAVVLAGLFSRWFFAQPTRARHTLDWSSL
ncbi:MAG: MIP/aquaporin family protein [Thermoanaerobaculia bacterium]